MKIECSNCKTVYDLDDKKIPNKKIKFKCRKCQNPVYVNKKTGSAGVSSQPKQMVCPKCHQQQAVSDECVHCGTTVVQPSRDTKPNGDLQPKPKLEIEAQPQGQQAANEEIVNCPKCSIGLRPDALECHNCGIILEKYRALEAKKKQAEVDGQQPAGEDPAQSENEIGLRQDQPRQEQ